MVESMNGQEVAVMNESVADAIARIELENDVPALLAEMRECLAITVATLAKLGAIIRRLESLDVDVLELKIPNMDYFRRIAHGVMLPEVFVSLSGCPMVLRRVSRLPLVDQQRVVDGERVKVMLRGGDCLMVAVQDLTAKQARQVFAIDHFRSESQQVAWLVEQDQQVKKAVDPPEVLLDRKRNGIVCGDVFLSAAELAGYLGDLAKR